jgi:hypothetical protein
MQPVHIRFRELANAEIFSRIRRESQQKPPTTLPRELRPKIETLCRIVKNFSEGSADAQTLSRELEGKLSACMQLPSFETGTKAGQLRLPSLTSHKKKTGRRHLRSLEFTWAALLSWLLVHALGKIMNETDHAQHSRSWIDEWLLGKLLVPTLQELGLAEGEAWRCIALVKILTSHQEWFEPQDGQPPTTRGILVRLLTDREVQEYLQVNRHQGVLWYNAESFDELIAGLRIVAAVDALAAAKQKEIRQRLVDRSELINRIEEAGERSGYQIEQLLELSMDPPSPTSRRGGSRR